MSQQLDPRYLAASAQPDYELIDPETFTVTPIPVEPDGEAP